METKHKRVLKIFKFRNILVPIVLGLTVTGYFIIKSFDVEALTYISLGWKTVFYLSAILLCEVLRQYAYMYRIRQLSGKQLTWRQSFDVISLWEFSSAVTPTVVGGSAVAIFFLNREKIPLGKSTAMVLTATFFDELFFVIMLPLSILLVGYSNAVYIPHVNVLLSSNYGITAVLGISYSFIFLLTLALFIGIFVKPYGFKKLLISIFSFPGLKRWKLSAAKTGDEMIMASVEFKGKPFKFWIRILAATFTTWTARFILVNFLILSVLPISDHVLVYTRQLMMWIILLFTPTPGASGVAEVIFSVFLGDIIPKGLGHPLALIWRLLTYYPYLLLGAIVLPIWLKRVYAPEQPKQTN
jgi:uncharacterized protein (TIRG00374 family)